MNKVAGLAAMAAFVVSTAGCAYMGGGTDLGMVARDAQLTNVTTGDGNFPNYTATGHYTGTEIGVAVGIPFLVKLFEIYPVGATNEALLTEVAKAAREDGANAMINVTPHRELYTGIPFFFVGVYVDSAEGTGIR